MDALPTAGIDFEPAARSNADVGNSRGPAARSILIGNETLLIECAAILERAGHDIVAVVASEGRVADWARAKDKLLFARPRDLLVHGVDTVDFIFSITNLSVLSPEILGLARRGAVNFHDGPLPAYAGLNTPVWALLAGEKEHGVTWHYMTEAVDAGEILAAETFAVEEGETALSLNMKCFEAGLRSFTRLASELTIGSLRSRATTVPIRFFGAGDRPTGAAMIDWSQPEWAIARLVQALSHGIHRNPMAIPRTLLGEQPVLVHELKLLPSRSGRAPGTVVRGGLSPVVATGTKDLQLLQVTDLDGVLIEVPEGATFTLPDADERSDLCALASASGRYERWWSERLVTREALQLPQFRPSAPGERIVRGAVHHAVRGSAPEIVAAFAAYLGRVADRSTIAIGYADPVYRARIGKAARWFAPHLPLSLEIDWEQPASRLAGMAAGAIADQHKRVAPLRDLAARTPALRGGGAFDHAVIVEIADVSTKVQTPSATALHAIIPPEGGAMRLCYDLGRLTADEATDLLAGFDCFLEGLRAAPERALGSLSLMNEAERRRVLQLWNSARVEVKEVAGIHKLIADQARRTPEQPAVTSRGRTISYAELDRRSNQWAGVLAQLGVAPGTLVGLHLERSVDLVIALLAIHKAGAAYVPLDPAYPADRIGHMIADSAMTLILSQSSLQASLPASGAAILLVEQLCLQANVMPDTSFDGGAGSDDLAYVIYTSGSTGTPKGVMVEHRNLLNFFAGMDAKLEPSGSWLAVTSLSFDISVLELCWPLTRGYHVVVATEREIRGDVPAQPAGSRPIDFSLFYFASADSAINEDQYRLLLEGARFADRHGFEAIWTPERHFHAFGGLYPNPSVTSAALAVITNRIKIRAGSVVAPLHHPARIAEEWALVDNLSGGRVGIAFASGWQPDDFLLRPEVYAGRNDVLMQTVDDVRALWRGERRAFPGPFGTDVEVCVYPRPVQPELPFWITSAGNAETFARAGRAGANILTHLLGQTVAEVADKIAVYRAARREAGFESDGHVTLMLHSFVGAERDTVKETVRGPLTEYLRTSTNLVKQYAWSFPALKTRLSQDDGEAFNLNSLTEEETEALLAHAFERYFESSGLFGTPESCLDLIRQLQAGGVDEIACLIDFGIATQTVLDHLPQLAALREASRQEGSEKPLPALIAEHGVTHLQCTPSLVQMMAADEPTRAAIASLTRLMVGGEAFPPHLARDMTRLISGTVTNMYGPTETTIWSAVHDVGDSDGAPPLGRPLGNQQIYILDSHMQPVRPGTPGELVIGGAGVVRGYLNRPELTRERFITDPVKHEGHAYRTGDLARQRGDGTLEFLGRLDHQVKIRGHRIELGEIEALLGAHPQLREAVVVARGGPGQAELIAYIAHCAEPVSDDELRIFLKAKLPEFMVPSRFVRMEALPRTPNGKIDRNGLPGPETVRGEPAIPAEPVSNLQGKLLEIWRDALGGVQCGIHDNFFDIGGHSLLAVQVHRKLSGVAGRPVALTDIFRFPTIAALSAHLSECAAQPQAAEQGQSRAAGRLAALQRRNVSRVGVRS